MDAEQDDEEKSSLETIEPQEPAAVIGRDAANWAEAVSRLEYSGAPKGAIPIGVSGKRLVGPVQGFGKMWQKTFKVPLEGCGLSSQEVVKAWKENFPKFWPKGNNFYGPLTSIAPGDVALLNLALPGRQKLSTGVMVLYADQEAFTLMTPEGHLFAGWITFSAYEEEGITVAQVQALERGNDPLYEIGLILGGHRANGKFWRQTLINLGRDFGVVDPAVESQMVVVDKKRQWSNAKNLRHNSAIRTLLYVLATPFRLIPPKLRPKTKD